MSSISLFHHQNECHIFIRTNATFSSEWMSLFHQNECHFFIRTNATFSLYSLNVGCTKSLISESGLKVTYLYTFYMHDLRDIHSYETVALVLMKRWHLFSWKGGIRSDEKVTFVLMKKWHSFMKKWHSFWWKRQLFWWKSNIYSDEEKVHSFIPFFHPFHSSIYSNEFNLLYSGCSCGARRHPSQPPWRHRQLCDWGAARACRRGAPWLHRTQERCYAHSGRYQHLYGWAIIWPQATARRGGVHRCNSQVGFRQNSTQGFVETVCRWTTVIILLLLIDSYGLRVVCKCKLPILLPGLNVCVYVCVSLYRQSGSNSTPPPMHSRRANLSICIIYTLWDKKRLKWLKKEKKKKWLHFQPTNIF